MEFLVCKPANRMFCGQTYSVRIMYCATHTEAGLQGLTFDVVDDSSLDIETRAGQLECVLLQLRIFGSHGFQNQWVVLANRFYVSEASVEYAPFVPMDCYGPLQSVQVG